MARGQNQYIDSDDFVQPQQKRFLPLRIPIAHWQLRHFVSHTDSDIVYCASGPEVYRINTTTRKRKLIAYLPFEARCTASGHGYICVGGETSGHFAAIKLDGSGEVDAALPIDGWRTRPPSVKVESIGEEIVNSISISRIQDPELHLDDIVAVVTNNDKTVRLYSLPQGVETSSTLRLPHPMNHATISPDGTMLVAVGDYNEAYFYTRELTTTPPLIPKPHNRLTSASIEWRLHSVCRLFISGAERPLGYFTTAWSPDGRHVAVGSEDGWVTILDVETVRHYPDADPVLATVPSSRQEQSSPYPGAVRSMIFSPSPWDLLIWAEDQGRICIGDMRSGLERRQVLHLDTKDEALERVELDTLTPDAAVQDTVDQRSLEDMELDFARRNRNRFGLPGPTFASEYLEARNRHRLVREQRQRNAVLSTTSPHSTSQSHVDDPRGLTADEQQILETLRTGRQLREARAAQESAGNLENARFNAATIIRPGPISSSSATSLNSTVESDTGGDTHEGTIRESDSYPDLTLTRMNANTSRPASALGSSTSLAAVPGDAYSWRHRLPPAYTPEPVTDTSSRSRFNMLPTPPDSQPQTSTTSRTARQSQFLPAEPDDRNPWQTIQDAMSLTSGPLFESASRVPADPPLPATTSQLLDGEGESSRTTYWRLRERMRHASDMLHNSRYTPWPEYDNFRARVGSYERGLGVRTAGLAMSKDGKTLWAACEEGIFEFKMNLKNRMFWPAMQCR